MLEFEIHVDQFMFLYAGYLTFFVFAFGIKKAIGLLSKD